MNLFSGKGNNPNCTSADPMGAVLSEPDGMAILTDDHTRPQSGPGKYLERPRESAESLALNLTNRREDLENLPAMMDLAERAALVSSQYQALDQQWTQMFHDAEQDGYQTGTRKVTKADGSKVTTESDGTVTTVDADGNVGVAFNDLGPRVALFIEQGPKVQADMALLGAQSQVVRDELAEASNKSGIGLPLDTPLHINDSAQQVMESLAIRAATAHKDILLKDNDEYRAFIEQERVNWEQRKPRVYKMSGQPGRFTVFDARSGMVIDDYAGTGVRADDVMRDYPEAWAEAYPNGYHDTSD